MPLKNSQYDILMRDYNRRQLNNTHKHKERIDSLYAREPRFQAIEDKLRTLYAQRARLQIEGNRQAQTLLQNDISILKQERAKLLSSLSLPADYLEIQYTCPDCKDTGYIEGVRCHCFHQAAVNLLYDQSHLRQVLNHENFSTFSLNYYSKEINPATGRSNYDYMKKVRDDCYRYATNFGTEGGNILFTGSTGLGKTFLSNCIAKEVIEHCHSVVYLTATELFNIFSRGSFSYEEEAAADVDHYVLDSDLLIIDDLGTERANSFTISKLFFCINERLVRAKGTIISTNLAPGEIRDQYTERISSRIMSSYEVIKLFGQDIRIAKKFGSA